MEEMQLIPDFDLDSIQKVVWVSKEAKKQWAGIIPQIGTLISDLEVLSVVRGHRPCSWQTIDEQHYHNCQKQKWADMGLKSIAIHRVGQFEGFAHKHAPVVEGQPVNVCVIVAKTQENCDAYKQAFETGDNFKQGVLLGYPECCSQFFCDVWPKRYIDPIWQAAMNPKTNIIAGNVEREDNNSWFTEEERYDKNTCWIRVKGNPLSNGVLRYMGLRAAFHIPCSFNCEATAQVAEQRMALGEETNSDLIKLLRALMHMPHSWDCYHGLAVVRTPIFYTIVASMPSIKRYVVEVKSDCDFIPKEAAKGLTWPFNLVGEKQDG